MKRYRLTGPARADLREIWNYVADYSERRADRLLEELSARFEDLAEQPLLMGSTDIMYGRSIESLRSAITSSSTHRKLTGS
jgi:plasmid stabilization system protein ParE